MTPTTRARPRRPTALAALTALACLTLLPATSRAATFDPTEQDLRTLQLAMADGRTTSVALVDAYLARIARYDDAGPALNAIAALDPAARAVAAALDAERAAQGPRGPLHGIPVLVKDNYETRGMTTTAGSILLEDFAPDADAELVARLRAAGAVILGKTNMHEFADGIETVGSGFGATRNPYDPRRHPGGSSGGTAAAVAASFAAVGMGSDTCGSIRNPSAHNALVGLRGTQGASSRRGILPLSSTQDIGGPLARTVTDLALVLDATVGYDPADPQTAASVGRLPASFTAALHPGALQGMRIGVAREFVRVDPEDDEVARVFEAALAELEALGATVVDVSVPDLDDLIYARGAGFYVLAYDFGVDLDAYLAQHPDAPVSSLDEIVASGRLHPSVAPLLAESAAFGPADREAYLDELAKRERLRTTVLKVMADARLDALTYPTIRRKATVLGETQPGSNCHLSANSGMPAISVPAGFTPDGMPVGIELLGRPWDDGRLLGFAYDFEQATHHRRPPALPVD
ncbi:MAG TPA: amidase family protein [Pseudomonadales bacterium]|nr:amidase family protein [Pseudomonadales bacterium]